MCPSAEDTCSLWTIPAPTPSTVPLHAQALNTRSSDGETPLDWVLKYGASGLLSGEDLAALVTRLVEGGASASVPAFQEQVRRAGEGYEIRVGTIGFLGFEDAYGRLLDGAAAPLQLHLVVVLRPLRVAPKDSTAIVRS